MVVTRVEASTVNFFGLHTAYFWQFNLLLISYYKLFYGTLESQIVEELIEGLAFGLKAVRNLISHYNLNNNITTFQELIFK